MERPCSARDAPLQGHGFRKRGLIDVGAGPRRGYSIGSQGPELEAIPRQLTRSPDHFLPGIWFVS